MLKSSISRMLSTGFLVLAPSCFHSMLALGQAVPSPSPFGIVSSGSYTANKLDTVNMDTGNDVINIPLFSLPQRGTLTLSFSALSNSTYWAIDSGCTPDGTDCWNYYTTLAPGGHLTTLHYGSIFYNNGIGPYITENQIPTFGEDLVQTSSGPYNFAYATLTKILLPQGGAITYGYQFGATCYSVTPWVGTYGSTMVLASKTITDINGHSETWTYNINNPALPAGNIVTDPAGNDTVITYQGTTFGPEPNCYDLEASRTVYAGSHLASNPVVLETMQPSYTTVAAPPPHVGGYYGYANVLKTSETTTLNGAVSAVSSTGYDSGTFTAATPTCQVEADGSCPLGYGDSAVLSLGFPTSSSITNFDGTVLTSTQTHYYWQDSGSPYWTGNILNTPETTTEFDGNNNQVAQTQFNYDENDGCPGGVKGHLTTTSRWNNAGSAIQTHTSWNCNGMVSTETDGDGYTTTVSSYDSTGIFPATVTLPPTNGVQHVHQYTWDANTGNMLTHLDPNNVTTKYTYSDPLGRLTLVQNAQGTSAESDTGYSYPSPAEIDTASDLHATGDGLLKNKEFYDGLGHVILTDGPDGAFVRTGYDYVDQPCAVANPSYSDMGALTCSTAQNGEITFYGRDALGRMTSLTHPDGTPQSWTYSGNITYFKNELNYQWQRTSDALNRLTQVVEPGNLTTNYTYDALNDLLSVDQLGNGAGDTPRVRTFTYDSLSRLLCASNPENSSAACPAVASASYPAGATSYVYDGNGNLISKVSPAPNSAWNSGITATTTYQYDQLNRLTYEFAAASSAPNTLVHNFYCDQTSLMGTTLTNPNGRLTLSTASFVSGGTSYLDSANFYWDHDPMGRVLGTQTCTPETCNSSNIANSTWFNLTNSYDFAGNPTGYAVSGFADGSSTAVNESYDGAGRLATVTSTQNGGTPTTLWASNSYNAIGLTQATLGNSAIETLAYNNRNWLQSKSTSANGATIHSEALTYYGDGSVDTVTDPVNGDWTYSYDSLGRLSTGLSTNTGQGCQFTYDSFGNRMSEAPYQSGSCYADYLTFSASATNQADTFCYDAAGNLLSPGACASGGSKNAYLYDAYGTLLVGNYNQSPYTSYSVDEYERRVAKWQSGAIDHQYLYGADGNPVAEADGAGNWLQTNVRAGGMFLAELQPSGITYLHTDHLGTIRAESDSTGARTMTCSNLPFGDALNCNGNTDPSGYHFTGKERDSESGNDYFGARYYGSSMGRFLSPDPSQLYYADQTNPQSFNLYSYGWNNPLINTDPSGMECVWDDGSYDAADDPDTGSADKCGAAGGTWEDPDFFENLQGIQREDWSGQASSSVVFNWLTPSATAYGGPNAAQDETAEITAEFLTGTGPTIIEYLPQDPFTLSFQTSAGMDAINDNVKAGCSDTNVPLPPQSGRVRVGTSEAAVNTFMDGVLGGQGLLTPEAQLGAFNATWVRDGGTVSITVTNPITLNSLFYHQTAKHGIPNPSSGPMSTIHQTLHIEEPDPCL